MNYKEYKVIVYTDGTKEWWFNGYLHREDGPACEFSDGHKEWWLNGNRHTEENFNKEIQKMKKKNRSCSGKIIEIEGKKYKLTEI